MATDILTGPTLLGTATRTRTYKNFIDGEWVESSTGDTFEDRNPADTRDVVGIFQKSGKADVDAAIEAAKRAFAKWRLVPAPRRAEIIYRAAEMLMERKEEYSRDMTREMGKVLKRNSWRHAGSHRHRLLHGRRRPPHVRSHHSFGTSQQVRHGGSPASRRLRNDYSVEFSHGDSVMEAVARSRLRQHLRDQTRAGHSASTFNLVRTLSDAGVPRGVINIVSGFGAEVGGPLMEHPDVRAISLTGSTAVGRIVGTTAAKSFKHCSLELGGKIP